MGVLLFVCTTEAFGSAMAGGKARSTRKLRSWMVEQVNSGKYPGVVWDDESKTMFRIPWKHAGKQSFRKDEDAALFKAWAEFKGKLSSEEQNNPASWKTRLRCALNKSPEFIEVNDRAQLDISEPYKVYRLVPEVDQVSPEKKSRDKVVRRHKRRSSEKEEPAAKLIKTEIDSPQSSVQSSEEFFLPSEIPVQNEETVTNHIPSPSEEMDEITLDVRIEESVTSPQTDQDSFRVVVQYLGHEVARQTVSGSDVRILYPSPQCPPCSIPLGANFPRVTLPDPCLSSAQGGPDLQALFTLLPFMDRGILLTSTAHGVYGRRFCQGRVFWTGPHSPRGLHKMERNTEPVLLFSKDIFKQQLDLFCANKGERPQCSFTLCFGELLDESEDPSKKLIIVQVNLPWAEQQVENHESIIQTINLVQSLADQSPMREIILNLELVSPSED